MNKLVRRRVFWNMAGISGLIVGGILTLAAIMAYLFRNNITTEVAVVNNIIVILAFIVVPYFLARRFAKKNALWGVTFQRAIAYMLVMYVLSGFIFGISTYIIYNLDMEYFIAESMKVADAMGMKDAANELVLEDIWSSPFRMAFNFMFTLPFLAFLPALIISALIKREPAIRNYK